MSKRQLLMIIGVWVIFFLFLGFPAPWDKGLAVATGVIIAAVAYSMAPKEPMGDGDGSTFVEHRSDKLP